MTVALILLFTVFAGYCIYFTAGAARAQDEALNNFETGMPSHQAE